MSEQKTWQQLQRGQPIKFTPEQRRAHLIRARDHGVSKEEALALLEQTEQEEVWLNRWYQVNVSNRGTGLVHLSIKRRDKQPVTDWRHKQWIKDQLVGPEHEGVELYPAQSRLVDTANQYHLWVWEDVTFRVPVGFVAGLVENAPSDDTGAVQRPNPPSQETKNETD